MYQSCSYYSEIFQAIFYEIPVKISMTRNFDWYREVIDNISGFRLQIQHKKK
ncbi:hypothetical protein ATC1_131347 [Flexilinea flocculi]|uniref:Uncharacterized protein n=1 Tax=Flexilinea flocculi TaxID=1678840 RepID=A0A0S7BX37_9CHLR|nr:hypothetical protein ATC1_131347 [Flexilinea flocculi]